MPARLGLAWRFALLGGLTAGLAVSPWVGGSGAPLAAVACAGILALAAACPRGGSPGAAWIWVSCLAIAAAALGLAAGNARLAAIDAGALELRPGSRVTVTGYVAAVPKRADDAVRVRVETGDGRLMVEVDEPAPDLGVGEGIEASGTTREPQDWERSYLERLGIATVLVARELRPTGARRGGLEGMLDGVRDRAEAALERGTSAAASALLRGFVLGEDDRIDAVTIDVFKRSGLAHILAVSGQNVILLALLANAVLAAVGTTRRWRLAWTLLLIAIYVPVAGAGPSIQRAGVMGAAGLVAALASRPRSRWYALLAAACATLAIDPRASGDVGWQLSFAAVIGIALWARPLSALIGGGRGRLRGAVADGAAMTLAATVATAPLMAHQFGTVSLTSLPANLVALPAEAPVMWLGMAAGAIGQLEWMPVAPLTAVAGACAGYIAQVAHWFGEPSWAQWEVGLARLPSLIGAYVMLGAAVVVALRWARRRTSAGRISVRGWHRVAGAVAAAAAIALALLLAPAPGGGSSAPPPLRISVLDVGQGDSILLEPRRGDPVLVDAGPTEADVAAQLAEHGVDRLAALVETHPQSDHVGGATAVLDRLDVGRLVFVRRDRASIGAARAIGADTVPVGAGDRLRFGRLRLDVLWPPPERLRAAPGSDPNLLSLVVLARFRGFEILLTGDAEAEAAPVAPGPVDVLKVAHHGSEDEGLDALLDRTRPRLALISVGADNPYGHPAPATLAELAAHRVRTLRTDTEGGIVVEVGRDGWRVR
jgi:competence protein ComEC